MVYGEGFCPRWFNKISFSLFIEKLFFFRENQKNILDSQFNAVPFEIRNANFRVIVKSSSEAHCLNLPVIGDHFEPSDPNLLGLLFGVHQKGFQYTEYLLRENDMLTGITNQFIVIYIISNT